MSRVFEHFLLTKWLKTVYDFMNVNSAAKGFPYDNADIADFLVTEPQNILIMANKPTSLRRGFPLG